MWLWIKFLINIWKIILVRGFTVSTAAAILFVPLLWVVISFYLYHYVEYIVQKEAKLINQELVYATRYIIIQVESGIPLYATFENISKNYEHVGRVFREINERGRWGWCGWTLLFT